MIETAFSPTLFAGRVVAVTGAGRGIGEAVARAFLACGARVVAHVGREPRPDAFADLPPEQAARLSTLAADLAAPQGPAALAEGVLAAAPRLDVLVANAGAMLGRFPLATMEEAQIEASLRLNVVSVVDGARRLLPALRAAAPGASIVVTTSISARTGGSAGSSLYSGAKAFLATWTRSLARELAPEGIRVNAVAPGTIMTDFHRRYSTPEKLEATARAIPLGRLGTPQDCAPAYLFLAAPELSGYVTGQTIEVNGGQLMA